MRYRGYFVAKLAAAAALLYGLLWLINGIWPAEPNPPPLAPLRDAPQILLYNLVILGWFLLCAGALVVIILDQRFRCRICLRRLRMPLETGSWGRSLLSGRPSVEYICPYGHGALKHDELQAFGIHTPEWTPNHQDFWQELCASSKTPRERQ